MKTSFNIGDTVTFVVNSTAGGQTYGYKGQKAVILQIRSNGESARIRLLDLRPGQYKACACWLKDVELSIINYQADQVADQEDDLL